MGKYCFLTGYYYPKPGATGVCIHQLAKETAKRGNDVTTICYADGDTSKKIDGVKIIKIQTPSFYRENMSDRLTIRKLNHLRSLVCRLVHIRKYPLRSVKLVNRFCTALEMLVNDSEQIVLIASVNPIEAVIAADRVKKKYPDKVKTIYYCADTLSNEKGGSGLLSAEYRTKCGIRWEKALFSSFDLVLIMECHKDHYFSNTFMNLTNKMRLVNFPLFTKMDTIPSVKYEKGLSMVYAGTLYKELRNPSFLCEQLVQLSKVEAIHVTFLGSGDCDDILLSANSRSNRAIEYIGMKSHDVAMRYLSEADVLLSIGNAESPMAPSKIYEYMSTGKPIIHTYTYEQDPCLEPLKKYGNSLLLRENEENSQKKIIDFIKERKELSYELVRDKFILSTPEYTVDMIEEGCK